MNIEQYIIEEYHKNKSPYEIAEDLAAKGITNYYPNKVRRALKKCGVKMRSKSEAQKQVLESGRASHPTQGKHHSDETKERIGNKISESWKNLSDEERERRSNSSKALWERMSDEEKVALCESATKGVRDAAENGSKIEKYLLVELSKLGYKVDFHPRHLILSQKLQVDLFIEELKCAIELDGPSHFFPIWGDEALEKAQAADQHKNGLLINNGYNIIRIHAIANKASRTYCRQILEKLIPVLDEIKLQVNRQVEDRLIIIKGDD